MPFRFGGDAVHVYLTINTILSLLEAIETRYPMADPEDPVDVLDESLTGTDPYAAPAAGPAR